MQVSIFAPFFIDVSVPTEDGFISGAEESFSAKVKVKAYIKLPWFGYVLVDRYQFKNAVLEFGVGYMCLEESNQTGLTFNE